MVPPRAFLSPPPPPSRPPPLCSKQQDAPGFKVKSWSSPVEQRWDVALPEGCPTRIGGLLRAMQAGALSAADVSRQLEADLQTGKPTAAYRPPSELETLPPAPGTPLGGACARCSALEQQLSATAQSMVGLGALTHGWSIRRGTQAERKVLWQAMLCYLEPCAHVDTRIMQASDELRLAIALRDDGEGSPQAVAGPAPPQGIQFAEMLQELSDTKNELARLRAVAVSEAPLTPALGVPVQRIPPRETQQIGRMPMRGAGLSAPSLTTLQLPDAVLQSKGPSGHPSASTVSPYSAVSCPSSASLPQSEAVAVSPLPQPLESPAEHATRNPAAITEERLRSAEGRARAPPALPAAPSLQLARLSTTQSPPHPARALEAPESHTPAEGLKSSLPWAAAPKAPNGAVARDDVHSRRSLGAKRDGPANESTEVGLLAPPMRGPSQAVHQPSVALAREPRSWPAGEVDARMPSPATDPSATTGVAASKQQAEAMTPRGRAASASAPAAAKASAPPPAQGAIEALEASPGPSPRTNPSATPTSGASVLSSGQMSGEVSDSELESEESEEESESDETPREVSETLKDPPALPVSGGVSEGPKSITAKPKVLVTQPPTSTQESTGRLPFHRTAE